MRKVDTHPVARVAASKLPEYQEDLLAGFAREQSLGRGREYLERQAINLKEGAVVLPGAYEKLKLLFNAYRKSINQDYPELKDPLERIEQVAKTFQEIRDLSKSKFSSLGAPLIIESQFDKASEYLHQQAERLKIPFKLIDTEVDCIRKEYSARATRVYLLNFEIISATEFSERVSPRILLGQLELYGKAASDCERRAGLKDKGEVASEFRVACENLAKRACPYYLERLESVLSSKSASAGEERAMIPVQINLFANFLPDADRHNIQKQMRAVIQRSEKGSEVEVIALRKA